MKKLNEFTAAWKIIENFGNQDFELDMPNNYEFEFQIDGTLFFCKYTIEASVTDKYEQTYSSPKEVHADVHLTDFYFDDENGEIELNEKVCDFVNNSITLY